MPNFELHFTNLSIVGNIPTNVTFFGTPSYKVGDGGVTLPFTDTIFAFVPTGNAISLNGGPFVSLQQLPAGFNVTSAAYAFNNIDNPVGHPGVAFSDENTAPTTDYGECISQYQLGRRAIDTHPGHNGTGGLAYGVITTAPIAFVNDLYQFLSLEVITKGKFTNYVARNIKMTAAYQILANSYTITSSGPYAPGDIVTVTATQSLDTITQINLVNLDPVTNLPDVLPLPIIFQSPTFIQFRFPPPPPKQPPPVPPVIEAIGNGTQFSGSVVLGTLTPLITNGSGIYQIVPGKTSDTIYTNSAAGSTTAEVKILDPSGKLGFVGG